MKNQFMAAVAVAAIVTASGVARAEDTSVKALKAQAAELKKQNAALEKRLSKLEGQQQAASSGQPSGTDFVSLVTKGPLEVVTDEGPICWKGICINGAVDGGLSYATHGLPINGNYYNGNEMITSKANRPYFGFNPNGVGNSQVGIKGSVEILPGLSGVFTANTYFNPQSGQLQNAPGSLVDNQGLSTGAQSLSSDGSRGGQAFNDQLNVGVSHKEFGTLTFGRHKTLQNDLVGAYDVSGAPAFSLVAYSGTVAAGAAYTGDSRWDNSLKYKITYGPVRFGAMYKFIDGNSGTDGNGNLLKRHNDAAQFSLGASYAGFDIDGVLGYHNQATTGSILTAAQLSGVRQFNGTTFTTAGINSGTLSGTAADATSGALGVKYTWNQWKFGAGWSHIILHNPKDPVGVGSQNDQGGYVYSSINNAAYPHAKLIDTTWFGVKYAYDPKTDIIATYQHVEQNSYGTDANKRTCNQAKATRSNTCSGSEDQVGVYVDYHFTKRFEVYGGAAWSTVAGGMGAGYLYSTNWAPTVGARFQF